MSERRSKILGLMIVFEADIGGHKLAAAHWNEMRREIHEDGFSRRRRDFLLDLRCMPVTGDTVRGKPLSRLREQDVLLERASGPGHARLCIDDDVRGVDEFGADDRQEREQRRRRIASRAGDESRGCDLFAVKLRQPVGGLVDEMRGDMLTPVPFGVSAGIPEAEIGRHVDDFDTLGQRRDNILSRAVRKPAEHGIAG